MDIIKTAGNWIFLCMLFLCSAASATLSLRIVDEQGIPLQQLQVGRPFVIEVAITDNPSRQAIELQGIEPFTVQEKGWSYQSINGQTTIKHNYTAIAYEPGEYTIGPATISSNQQEDRSNSVVITVGEQELKQATGGEQEGEFLLRLTVDKSQVVQGERMIARLRFYFTDPSHRLRNLIEQESAAFQRKKARGPIRGQEEVDGIPYHYLEWNWDMYPQKVGSLMVPALGAEYEQERKRDHLWGGLGRLFGAYSDLKRIYSNAVSVTVDDIPSSSQPIQGVGTFDSFTLSAHPAVARQGEGVVVTLMIRGDADPDRVTLPGLQGMPEELRAYESQQTTQEPKSPDEKMSKQYEYIIQGLKTGSWHIPAQQFHYYDTADRAFKTLKTAPLTVTIMPGSKNQLAAPANPLDEESLPINQLPITNDYWQPEYQFGVIPWWLFLLAIAVPFLAWMFKQGHSSMHRRMKKNYRARRAYNAFSHALSQLKKLQKKDRSELLYALFIQLFADRWQLSLSTITQQLIEQRLKNVGMSEEQLNRWQTFFAEITAQAFGGTSTKNQIEDLFNQAELWLQELKQSL